MPPVSRRVVVAGVVAGVVATCGTLALQSVRGTVVSRSTEHDGPYELRYVTRDAFGHRGTSKDVYYRPSVRATLVATHVGRYFVDPHDASRLLYERCPGGAARCGVWLFEGRAGRSRRVHDEHPVQLWALDTPWSPDGRTAAFLAQFSGDVVDLASGRRVPLAAALALGHAGTRREILGRATWTPEGRLRVPVVVGASAGVRSSAREEWEVDAARETVRRVQ